MGLITSCAFWHEEERWVGGRFTTRSSLLMNQDKLKGGGQVHGAVEREWRGQRYVPQSCRLCCVRRKCLMFKSLCGISPPCRYDGVNLFSKSDFLDHVCEFNKDLTHSCYIKFADGP